MTTYSIDQNLTTTSAPTFNGLELGNTLVMDGAAINEAEEIEVNATAETTIGNVDSNNVRIAGSETITAFDAADAGIVRRVRFTGVCTLTHNPTSLVLPGGANITTAVGDCMIAESYGLGNWKVLFYQKASGLVPGLGTMATQNANNVAITGGSITGITDLTVADGGTGASTAAGARTNLGVGTGDSPEFTAVNIGHASDTTVARASAGDISVEGNIVYRAGGTDVPVADGGTGASTAAGARSNLGLAIGTDVQPYDADLAALAALTPTDNNIIVGNGSAWVAESGDTARTSVGVGSADNVQHATLALGGARTEGVVQINPGAAGSVTAPINGDELVVEGSGTTGISILMPDANSGFVFFGSPSDNDYAYVAAGYDAGTPHLGLSTNRAGGKLTFEVEVGSGRGEWSDAGLAMYASGVTPQHDGTLHVMEGNAGTVTVNSQVNTIVAESNGNGGITIVTPDANGGYLDFTSPSTTATQGGRVEWNYNNGALGLSTNKSGGKLQFLVDSQSLRGEWNTTGLTVLASGATTQHDAPLHVLAGSAGSVSAVGSGAAVFESNSNCHIHLLSPDANSSTIYFGSPSDNDYGSITGSYNSGTEQIQISSANLGSLIVRGGNGDDGVLIINGAASTPRGAEISFTNASPNNTTQFFLRCVDSGPSNRCYIMSNGNLQNANNSYGAISDERLKRDVRVASSQWGDVKALAGLVKKFRFSADVATNGNAPLLLGWIAQDVQKVSPGLVAEGPDGMFGVQYSIAYMKAFKALGEAMERIERLEAKFAA